MNISSVDINLVIWLAAIFIVVALIFVIVRFFFRHILHFVIRGCGVIAIIVILIIILRSLKLF